MKSLSDEAKFVSGLSQSMSPPVFASGLSQSVAKPEQKSEQNSDPQFDSGLIQSAGNSSPVQNQSLPQAWQIESKALKKDNPLGKGSYGQVFLGEYHREPVAIKVYDFRGQLSAKDQKEIFLEAQTMASLHSQFLVGFKGVCVDPQYCLVMEYCEGGSLRKYLDNDSLPLAFVDQLRWSQQMSCGLYQLHSLRILHRDLKSENILLDQYGNAKIADFGLSVVKASSISQSNRGGHSVAGTLPWMAPELFSGESNTQEADIYSLGIVLWEIATRKKPFQGIAPQALVAMVIAGVRPSLEESCPRFFQELIKACWQAEPQKRPSAKAVVDKLKAASSSLEAIPAAPAEKLIAPIEKLLQFVVEGEQEQAEALIKQDRALLLLSGRVTDLSQRTFNKITAFQYAVWAMDRHMWKMILPYLSPEEAARQLSELEFQGTEHGRHFNFYPILKEYAIYYQNAEKIWKYDHSAQYQWSKVIGDAQKKLPVFVVNEFCREDRSFLPRPDFKDEKLPRTRKIRGEGKEWFTAEMKISTLCGKSFAYFRGNTSDGCRMLIGKVEIPYAGCDFMALSALSEICLAELTSLKSQLLSKLPDYSRLTAIDALEQLEKKEQIQVEIKKNFPIQNELVAACESGDFKAVQSLIAKGASPANPNSVGKPPLGAAVWGMNPEIVHFLLKRLNDRNLMDWKTCEQHNQQFYPNTFMFMDFKPNYLMEWTKLLELMELSPFLQEQHMRNIDKSFASDWESLRKKVDATQFDWIGHDPDAPDPDLEIRQVGATEAEFMKLRQEIRQAIESRPLPLTDLFKPKSSAPPPPPPKLATTDKNKKCLLM